MPDYDPEQSDLLLYHVKILEDMGELTEALTLLDVNAKSRAIVDRVAVMETRGAALTYGCYAVVDRSGMTARLLSRQGPGMEAEQAWRALIHCNPDNTSYYYGFFSSNKIDLGEICLVFWRMFFIPHVPFSITPQELLQTMTVLLRYVCCETFQCRILVPVPLND